RDQVEVEAVQQREQVAAEVVDAVRAGRRGRAAVAAVVVAQHPEVPLERGELRLPQLGRRAERVAEDEDRRAGPAGQLVVQVNHQRTPDARRAPGPRTCRRARGSRTGRGPRRSLPRPAGTPATPPGTDGRTRPPWRRGRARGRGRALARAG